MFLPPEHWSSGMILASGARGRGFNSPMLPQFRFAVVSGKNACSARPEKNTRVSTHDGTRTHNLALRRGTPYPFGHAGGMQGHTCLALYAHVLPHEQKSAVNRHLGRVVKAVDSKSTGLCPRQFESGRCRQPCNLFTENNFAPIFKIA